MVKKIHNPLKIDYKKCIIEDKLLQIRDIKNANTPELIPVWTIQIEPKNSKYAIELIRAHQLRDPISLQHIKRIKKENGMNILTVVLFSLEYLEDKVKVENLVRDTNLQYTSLSCNTLVPRVGPSTKELITQWSKQYWPLTWNGNPNDQILNDYTFDMDFIKTILIEIARISEREFINGNKYPIVSIFIDPKNKELKTIAVDARSTIQGCVLDHSIMQGIEEVARQQRHLTDSQMGSSYLCLNYDVYTTHEPCSMCCMALIHSRIKRCIFVKPMDNTGCLKPESGEGYCVHNNKILNSKYEVFQWIGNEYGDIPELNQNTCC